MLFFIHSERMRTFLPNVVLLVSEGPEHHEFHRGVRGVQPHHDRVFTGRLGDCRLGDDQGHQVFCKGRIKELYYLFKVEVALSRLPA